MQCLHVLCLNAALLDTSKGVFAEATCYQAHALHVACITRYMHYTLHAEHHGGQEKGCRCSSHKLYQDLDIS